MRTGIDWNTMYFSKLRSGYIVHNFELEGTHSHGVHRSDLFILKQWFAVTLYTYLEFPY